MTRDDREFPKAVRRLTHRYRAICLRITPADMIQLIAQVQLALRHPANAGGSATAARELVEEMIEALASEEPVIGRVLRRGFDWEHDVPVEPAPSDSHDGDSR